MSDIAVVILDVYDEDHVAFWVFARLMQRIRGNFEKSQKAIKLQVNLGRLFTGLIGQGGPDWKI